MRYAQVSETILWIASNMNAVRAAAIESLETPALWKCLRPESEADLARRRQVDAGVTDRYRAPAIGMVPTSRFPWWAVNENILDVAAASSPR
jgi:hypothetical protein